MSDTEVEYDEKAGKAAGAKAFKAINVAEKLFDQHDALIAKIHPAIIAVGEKLQAGRDLHQFDNNAFEKWVEENKLDQGRIFGRRQERTAAMQIYRLTTIGYAEDEEGMVPLMLDLTDCNRARPGDIITWARKEQPMLFDDLRKKALAAKNKKPAPEDEEDELNDEIGDLTGGNVKPDNEDIGEAPYVRELKAENKRLRNRVTELERQVEQLETQLLRAPQYN